MTYTAHFSYHALGIIIHPTANQVLLANEQEAQMEVTVGTEKEQTG